MSDYIRNGIVEDTKSTAASFSSKTIEKRGRECTISILTTAGDAAGTFTIIGTDIPSRAESSWTTLGFFDSTLTYVSSISVSSPGSDQIDVIDKIDTTLPYLRVKYARTSGSTSDVTISVVSVQKGF